MAIYKFYRAGSKGLNNPAIVATNDGVNWDTVFELSTGWFSSFVSCALDATNNKIVAMSEGHYTGGSDTRGLWVGPADGSGAFQQVTSPAPDGYNEPFLRFLNGKFFLFVWDDVAYVLRSYTSTDGLIWTAGGSIDGFYYFVPEDGVYATLDGVSYVLVGQYYSSNSIDRPGIVYSTDMGANWSVTGLFDYPNDFGANTRLAEGASLVVAASFGNILTTANGWSWSFHHAAPGTTYCIASDGNQTFAAGCNGTGVLAGVHYSTDNGANWDTADVPGSHLAIVDIRYASGQWIALDTDGRLFTATNPAGPWTDYGITCPSPDSYNNGIGTEATGTLTPLPEPTTYFWKNYVNAYEVL